MLIGSHSNDKHHYSDNKVYRGIRHYDSLPLTSGDLHEYSDTVYMKTAYIMNNIVGYGTLNSPSVTISNAGIRLNDPAVVLIDGDVSLIQSDDNTPIISTDSIESAGHSEGVVCIVGWYQHILAETPLRNYGGVKNSIISIGTTHDLIDNEFKVQISTRYQFRWMPIILNSSDIAGDRITFQIDSLDKYGEVNGTAINITSTSKSGNVFIAPKPSAMDYALSDLYVVPIIKYQYSSGNLIGATASVPVSPKGSSGFVSSETEPTGEYADGTTWYNPITREFKTYVSGSGFVSNTSTMGFLQYQSVYTIQSDISNIQDIVIPVNIDELEERDILQVVYEGLTLSAGTDYTINYNNHTITLLNFSVYAGERITFTATKIVEANDITNITTTFTTHMASIGSSTIGAHVRLSDSADANLDSGNGVAATPKAVYESTILRDADGTGYKFGVASGMIYIEEV